MFNNTRYGNLLTVILIVAIIAILGIVAIIGYRIYNSYYIDTGATQAATQFEQAIQQNNIIGNGNVDQQNTIKEDITGIDNTTNIGVGNSGGGNGSSSKTTYKGYVVVGTIQIPDIKLNYPILEKLSAASLKTSVVLMYTAQGLNNPGNSVIIGHNYRNGKFFSNNKKLSVGDKINITDESGKKLTYTIYEIFETTPEDTEYMTRDTGDNIEISLSTCTDDGSKRLVILAKV